MSVTHYRRHPLLARCQGLHADWGTNGFFFLFGGTVQAVCCWAHASLAMHVPALHASSRDAALDLCLLSWWQVPMALEFTMPLLVLPLDSKGDPPLPSPPGGSPLAERPCPPPEAQKHLFSVLFGPPVVGWASHGRAKAPRHWGWARQGLMAPTPTVRLPPQANILTPLLCLLSLRACTWAQPRDRHISPSLKKD